MRISARIVCIAVAIAAALAVCPLVPVQAQQVNDLPTREMPLRVRIDVLHKLLHGNHWNEGLFQNHVIFPPAGEERPVTGNHEDVAGVTAGYLAALSHQYATTKDPAVRAEAGEVMSAILNLEKVTGVPGVCARGFYRTDKPLWHEQAFFFSMEWHESKSMPGYRWEGDLSSDKFVDFFYGVGLYWELCADDEHKQLAADFIDRFVGRCVEHNFKLVDVDGKMTLWGNFCPDLPHEELNALEMLAGLRVAHKMTGKASYLDAYHHLIQEHHYDDEAILAKTLWPKEWTVPWDDELAAKSLYMIMRYEDDPNLLRKFRMCMNRFWHDWKDGDAAQPNLCWFQMLYQVLMEEKVLDEKWAEGAKKMWGFYREKQTHSVPSADGTRQVEAEVEEISSDVFRTYWFGRQYGLIDPAW